MKKIFTPKRIFLAYFVLLHVLLGFMIWESFTLRDTYKKEYLSNLSRAVENELHYRRMLMYHKRSVETVPDDALILIGDSFVQGLCVTAIAPNSINYGIGADTTSGVLQRLPVYSHALKRAQAIVIIVGSNDFKFRSVPAALENYRLILSELPDSCTTIVSSVLPVDESALKRLAGRNQQIAEFNRGLKQVVSQYTNVVFLDNTAYFDTDGDRFLDEGFHRGDGLHLNTKGNELLVKNIKQILAQFGA